MYKTVLTLLIGAALGACGMTIAGYADHGKAKVEVKTVSARDITEKLDGKLAKATVVEVTIEPGTGSAPHRHAGPVFGYVLEGEYEWAIDDQPARKLKVGDTFYSRPAACTGCRATPPPRGGRACWPSCCTPGTPNRSRFRKRRSKPAAQVSHEGDQALRHPIQ